MCLFRGLAAFLFLLSFLNIEAKLMGKGLGYLYAQENTAKHERPRPWQIQHAEHLAQTPESAQNWNQEPERNRPCVGLCYYEKLLRLQGKKEADSGPNQTAIQQEEKKQPCVGICQYYRSLGLENPAAYPNKKL